MQQRLRKIMGTFIAVFIGSCFASGVLAADGQLPKTMIWTAYDLGSSGYAEATGIANALQQNNKTRVRIMPSGTSIGRVLPLSSGRASFGFLANEVYFAAEGIYDFSDPSWGPQDMRVVLGRPAGNGLAVAADVGAKTIADLRGKRIGFVKGNPSVNVKTEAQLAFGGLTMEDIIPVWFGSYKAMGPALLSNQIDARNAALTSSFVREMEASKRGLVWMPFDPKDKAGWAALNRVASFASPFLAEQGAGISKENPVWMMGYRYPMITTYASTSADEVYNLVKAIDEAYPLFNGTTASSHFWEISKSIRTPADAPWHEGAIRYAKEKGYWTDEDQAWQDARLARLEKVKALWDKATDEFEQMRLAKDKAGEKVNVETEWPSWWDSYRKKHLE